jgi:23S rRNA maturation-related 3'-5' exoribonuclease YhaM
LKELYEKFMEYIKEDSRSEKLLKMYEDFNGELSTAPASGRTHFHNAFPGGFLDHTMRVVDTALQLSGTYKKMGGTIDFTKQELIFAAIHHDLGKLGRMNLLVHRLQFYH